jgi:hypothetical protein
MNESQSLSHLFRTGCIDALWACRKSMELVRDKVAIVFEGEKSSTFIGLV